MWHFASCETKSSDFSANMNAPDSKPVLPSAAQTKHREGLKICTRIVLTLTGDQKVFSQPCQQCNFLSQGGAIHGCYASINNDTFKI